MEDIVERLRFAADDTDAVENASVASLLEDAAAEIHRLRITDEEMMSIEAAVRIIDAYEEEMDGFPSYASKTLRGLLDRLG